jgi:hypothetical protein
MPNHSNTLKQLYGTYPNKKWDAIVLAMNPNVDIDLMRTMGFIDYSHMVDNVNLTWDFVMENINTVKWEKDLLSMHKCVTWDIYNKYKHLDIFDNFILMNPNTTWENILTFDIMDEEVQELMQYNPNITWDIVVANPQIDWCYNSFSKNRNMTLDIIIKNPDELWNMTLWSEFGSMKDIEANIDMDWNIKFLSCNYNLTIDMIIRHPEFDWDWYNISKNPAFTAECVAQYPDLPWEESALLLNPAFEFADYEYVSFEIFSANPNAKYEDFIANPNANWCWENVSVNPFRCDPYFDSQLYKQRCAAQNI